MYEAMVAMFGYGQLTARMWLVGLEEHCGDETDINERIGIRTAQPELMYDVEDFHQQLAQGMPAIEHVSVWSIGLQLYERTYGQPTFIGRLAPHQSALLLAEILPLPRPQHHHWPAVYQQAFATAEEYVQAALPQMSQRLCELAAAHRPEAVVLHGKGKHDRWIKGHPVMGNGWTLFRYGESANETLKWKLQDEVLWLRTNNLVNNGHITWGQAQIDAVAALIQQHRIAR